MDKMCALSCLAREGDWIPEELYTANKYQYRMTGLNSNRNTNQSEIINVFLIK